MTRLRVFFAALVVIAVALGPATALFYSRSDTNARHRAEQRDIARNCTTLQHDWDTLSAVVHTAYETRSLSVDPKTLPPSTQALLAALAPLLKQTSGKGNTTEQAVLSKLGDRPIC